MFNSKRIVLALTGIAYPLGLVLVLGATACTDCKDPKNGNKCRQSPIGSRLSVDEVGGAPATGGTGGSVGGAAGKGAAGGKGGADSVGGRGGSNTAGADDGGADNGGTDTGGTGSLGICSIESGEENEAVTVFDGEPDPGSQWERDNAFGDLDGATAVHPRMLEAGGDASMTFDCEGAEHTQIRFATLRRIGNADLELFEGETSRGKLSVGFGWSEQVINVRPGAHEYTLKASATGTTGADVPFVLDRFVCSNAEPYCGPHGIVDFDDDFVPLEMDDGWQSDNVRGFHQGDAAVHPPVLEAGDSASMRFNCGGAEHTQISFAALRLIGNADLELMEDSTPRGTLSVGFGWSSVVVNVRPGRHEYKLTARATGTTGADIPFVLDTFVCTNEEPVLGPNGIVDFDDRFIPLEVDDGWLVDNLRGVHQGEAAIHPPALEGGETSSMSFTCGLGDYSEVSFAALRVLGGAELEVFEDAQSRGVQSVGFGWGTLTFKVAPSSRFTVQATNPGMTLIDFPFVLDTFVCK